MMKKNEKSSRFGRVLRFFCIAIPVLLLASLLGVFAWAGSEIDREADQRMFESLGTTQSTRIYVSQNAEGEPYEPIEYDVIFGHENTVWAKSEEIPDALKNAFVAIEDRRFYTHKGVDFLRTGKAAVNYLFRFERHFGGSTITQQLVKNVLGEKDVTAKRKIKEMIRARRIERQYSKDEILTMYLNIVPLSNRCVGVSSAAQLYFGKSLADLSVQECASLASITNLPTAYDPVTHAEAHLKRRNLVLSQMHAYGYLTEKELESAKNAPLVLSSKAKTQSNTPHNWFVETVLKDVTADLSAKLHITKEAASHLVYGGGLRIHSTMNVKAQEAVDRFFSEKNRFLNEKTEDIDFSFVLISPKTGHLLALSGGIGEKKADRLYCGATDLKRPPGSALKPIALFGPALESGLVHFATAFDDLPQAKEEGGQIRLWPRNSPNVYQGKITLHEALAKSKNTVAVKLYELFGPDAVAWHLRQVGIDDLVKEKKNKSGQTVTDYAPSPLALGQLTDGITLRELTQAYTALAGGGMYRGCISYTAVYDKDNRLLLSNETVPTRIYSEANAYILTQMLTEVTEYGTARSLGLKKTVDVAGKTGTSGGDFDRLFVGYTPSLLGGIRVSSFDGGAIGNRACSHISLWGELMGELVRLYERENQTAAKSFCIPYGVEFHAFCKDSGMSPSQDCLFDSRADRVDIGPFTADNAPTSACQLHKKVYFDPITGAFFAKETPYSMFLKPTALLAGEKPFHVNLIKPLDQRYYMWYYEEEDISDTESEQPVHLQILVR